MNKLKTQIHKEFDEKFPNTLEEVITDSGYYVNKKLKSFIDQAINKAYEEGEKSKNKEVEEKIMAMSIAEWKFIKDFAEHHTLTRSLLPQFASVQEDLLQRFKN